MSNVVNSTFIKRFIIAAAKIINFIIKLKLFIKFVEYINVFDIEKVNVLTTHNKNKYAINLNKNKSFFKSLYNFLIKKLKILKIYLNAVLTKK
jgi:hypothetical protein